MIRYFTLSENYSLRGWKFLPYALQALNFAKTEFFQKPDFKLLLNCDGHTAIDWDALTPEQQKKYEEWEKLGFIRPCDGWQHLLPEQEYRFYPARFKEYVQWSITGRCNYRCRHCFMSAPHAAQGEPTWDELMTMLDAFERCGVRNLQITGGEPMVRRDFWELVDEILRRGLTITTLYSNGLLVTDEFLDRLEARKIYPSIQFSFDGVGHHDWMRGIPSAHPHLGLHGHLPGERALHPGICEPHGFPGGPEHEGGQRLSSGGVEERDRALPQPGRGLSDLPGLHSPFLRGRRPAEPDPGGLLRLRQTDGFHVVLV